MKPFISVYPDQTQAGVAIWENGRVAQTAHVLRPENDAKHAMAILNRAPGGVLIVESPPRWVYDSKRRLKQKPSARVLVRAESVRSSFVASAQLRDMEVVHCDPSTCVARTGANGQHSTLVAAQRYAAWLTDNDFHAARAVCVGIAWLTTGQRLPDTSTWSGKRRI